MEIIVDGHHFSDSQSDIVIGITEEEIKDLAKNPETKVVVYKSKSLLDVNSSRVKEDEQEMKEIMRIY